MEGERAIRLIVYVSLSHPCCTEYVINWMNVIVSVNIVAIRIFISTYLTRYMVIYLRICFIFNVLFHVDSIFKFNVRLAFLEVCILYIYKRLE